MPSTVAVHVSPGAMNCDSVSAPELMSSPTPSGLPILEDDLRLDLRSKKARQRQGGFVVVGVADRVVVHARPDQRVELERVPHGFVRKRDLAADRLVSALLSQPHQFGFNRVRAGQVERRVARRGWNLNDLAVHIGGRELLRESLWIDHAARAFWREARRPTAIAAAISAIAALP